MNKNIKLGLIILGVAVLLIAAISFGLFYQKRSVVEVANPSIEVVEGTEETSPVGTNSEAPIKTPTKTQILAYADALKRYANKRLQVSPDCQITPNNVTYKNGTTFMIDNRSNKAKTIKIGSTYTIPAYSFRIVTLSSAQLPATYYIDCDKSQNSGTVILQK